MTIGLDRPTSHTHTHTRARACTHTHAHRSEGYSTDALQSISINNPSGGDYRIAVRTARRHPHGSAVAHRLLAALLHVVGNRMQQSVL